MRHVSKQGSGGFQLEQAHENPPHTSVEATSRWSSFAGKSLLKQYLYAEQYALCAYTEVCPALFGLGTQIEHLVPKSVVPARTFDYSNLVMNALSTEDLKRLDHKDIFGGHAKQADYNPLLFISCLQPDCAQYFAYLSNGKVEPSYQLLPFQKFQAQYTIDLLHLNSPYLVNLRKQWLEELDQLIEQHIADQWSLEHLAALDLLPAGGQLSPFCTATCQRFGPIAQRLLAEQAA